MDLSTYELIKYPAGQYALLRQQQRDPGNPASGLSSLKDLVGFFASEDEAREAYDRAVSRRPTDARDCSNTTSA